MAELTPQPTSIQSLYSWYSENKLYVNRRYQRKLVWTLTEKQRLIESILKRYPIPAILVAERDGTPGTYEIIDGLQRLHAIVSFIETAFSTLDGKVFGLSHFPTAKSRADEGKFIPSDCDSQLGPKDVTTLLDYTFALTVMRSATEAEVNDVFGRINTYGHRLSDQERRQAGVQNNFSEMVRTVACTIRGDESKDILQLDAMPSISIDLPMTKHGYEVKANEVFWVDHGILRSTDLRDSLDEQCIADIAACIVGGQLIERSKDALDDIYTLGSAENQRISNALEIYGVETFSQEFKYCIDELLKFSSGDGKREKLRDIIFSNRTTNAFPSVFAALILAIHELTIQKSQRATDYAALKLAITNIDTRIETSRKATSPEERRKNIQAIKAQIEHLFIKDKIDKEVYGAHSCSDIDATIRRSAVELAHYELKQGLLTLAPKREIDKNIIDKVVNTICAIANNGPSRTGKLIIGVTDKDADAKRIAELDGVTARQVANRKVVGILREAVALGISPEQYYGTWKKAIADSDLSSPLKEMVLSNIDFNSYYGLGLIVITIPEQNDVSMVGDKVYWREGDSTKQATDIKEVLGIGKRFQGKT